MYFWALQSLRTVNECIASIISTWQDYDKFSLMPAHSRLDTDAQINSYIWKINRQIQKLIELKSTNNKRQEDIRSLRDGVSRKHRFRGATAIGSKLTISKGFQRIFRSRSSDHNRAREERPTVDIHLAGVPPSEFRRLRVQYGHNPTNNRHQNLRCHLQSHLRGHLYHYSTRGQWGSLKSRKES